MDIQTDIQRYWKAMTSMDGHGTALAIERRYGLDGYPPELVSIGLQAIADGKEPHEAIEAYAGA